MKKILDGRMSLVSISEFLPSMAEELALSTTWSETSHDEALI